MSHIIEYHCYNDYILSECYTKGHRCLRKCKCGSFYMTDDNGNFWCEKCGVKRYQDVSKLKEKGLDYPMKINGFIANKFFALVT